MRCRTCGAEMKAHRGNYRYEASGLSNVTLGGVTVYRCAKCGNHEVLIPRIEELHRGLARFIVEKPCRLMGEEIRFLRKCLGLSQADFAETMGVQPERVSRWETGSAPMGVTADRLLRVMVERQEPKPDYSLDLRHVAVEEPKRVRIGARVEKKHGWKVQAA